MQALQQLMLTLQCIQQHGQYGGDELSTCGRGTYWLIVFTFELQLAGLHSSRLITYLSCSWLGYILGFAFELQLVGLFSGRLISMQRLKQLMRTAGQASPALLHTGKQGINGKIATREGRRLLTWNKRGKLGAL